MPDDRVPVASVPMSQIVTPNEETSESQRLPAADGGGQTARVADDWRVPGVEKFQNPRAVAEAYLAAQKEMSRHQSRSRELETYFATNIAPWWDQYVEYVKAQQGQNGGKKTGKTDETAPEGLEQLTAVQQNLGALGDRIITQSLKRGSRDFFRDNPDALKYDQQIAQIIDSGVVSLRDQYDADAYYEAAEAAWGIVKSKVGPTRDRARAASEVEGGGAGEGPGDEDLHGLSLAELKRRAYGGDVVVR